MAEAKKEVVRVQATGIHRPIEDRSFLAVIAAAAADPKCDVTKMQALLDMQKQMDDRESVKAFTRDFIALQRVLPVINRDGKIEIREKDPRTGSREHGRIQQATPYATYPNIMKVCKPLMEDHGFALASWVEPEPGGQRIVVVSQLDHVEHHHRQSRFPLPAETSGSKNNVQGWGSAQQYGMRYNAIALLNIVSEAPQDRDNDGHQGNFKPAKGGGVAEVPEEVVTISAAQAHEIEALLEWAGISEKNFCTHYGIAEIKALPAELFAAAEKEIKDHKAKRDAKGR